MTDTTPIFDDPRFQPLPNWDWSKKNINGHKVRYGLPRSRKTYRATCLIIGGLGDFGEQYYEFSRDLDAHGIKPIIIDLPGQGGSDRYLDNPHKRHSLGFDALLQDLHSLIDEIVLSASIDAENNHVRLPMILFGHSLGGHLALRYLAEYNKTSRGSTIFSAAAITAPMLGIKPVDRLPKIVSWPYLSYLSLFPTAYVPGGCNWTPEFRDRIGLKGIFSHDPVRSQIQAAYFTHPDYKHLAIGSPTNKWLLDALKSCRLVRKAGYLEKIDLPLLVSIAGDDQLVSNSASKKAANRIPECDLQIIDGAEHEIVMEMDQYRNQFIERFFTFLENNVFNKPENGKTFIV